MTSRVLLSFLTGNCGLGVVTTPSAKADGFLGHARSTLPRFVPKAQSEPENITGCVDISVNDQPTRARMNTVSKSFGNIGQASTSGAYLRSPVGVNPDKSPTSVFYFVSEFSKERSPCRIVDRTSEHPSRQSFDIQILDGDKAVVVGNLSTEFVLKVRPLATNVGVSLLEKPYCLSPVSPAFLTSDDLPLYPSQVCQPRFQVPRVIYQFSVGENSKGIETHVNTDSIRFGDRRADLTGHAKTGVPLSGLTFQGEGLNFPIDETVHLQLDDADTLNLQSTLFSKVTAVPPNRECEAVKPVTRLEARVTRFLTSLNPTKESLESLVYPSKHVLAGGVIGKGKIARITYLFKLVGLIVVVTTNLSHPPCIPALLERGVVQRAGLGQLVFESVRLLAVGVEAVLISSAHLFPPLGFDVLSDCGFTHVPNGANIVTPRPKAREFSSEFRKLRAQNTRRGTFKLVHNVLNRLGRLSRNKHVNVVRHYFYCLKVNPQFRGLHIEHLFQAARNMTREYLFTILRTPYQVILDVVDTARISLVSITHNYNYTIVTYISQALVLKEDDNGY